jgi:hypothetical protein
MTSSSTGLLRNEWNSFSSELLNEVITSQSRGHTGRHSKCLFCRLLLVLGLTTLQICNITDKKFHMNFVTYFELKHLDVLPEKFNFSCHVLIFSRALNPD